jgi:hypothetical protein
MLVLDLHDMLRSGIEALKCRHLQPNGRPSPSMNFEAHLQDMAIQIPLGNGFTFPGFASFGDTFGISTSYRFLDKWTPQSLTSQLVRIWLRRQPSFRLWLSVVSFPNKETYRVFHSAKTIFFGRRFARFEGRIKGLAICGINPNSSSSTLNSHSQLTANDFFL